MNVTFVRYLTPSSMEKNMMLSHAHASHLHMRSCHKPMNVKTTHMFHHCSTPPLSMTQNRGRNTTK